MPQDEELAFINDPDQWPNWPVLPMKNRTRKWGDEGHMGLLFDWGGFSKPDIRPVVVHANMFMFDASRMDEYKKEEYATLEDMQAAGWAVD